MNVHLKDLDDTNNKQSADKANKGNPSRRKAGKNALPLLASLAVLASASAAQAASPPFPLGVFVGNPNGNSSSAEASFETQFKTFTTDMKAQPRFMDAFTDFGQSPSQWPSNASWTAWSWAKSAVVGTHIVPVIGIPMADNSSWNKQDVFFKAIVAGTYDADYKGIVDSWANNGFKMIFLRLGYEFNGGFMPWYCSTNPATQADWIAAFQHLSALSRQEAAADGIAIRIVWNPAQINWTGFDVAALYAGDRAVDVIATDAYSPEYPLDLTNWATGGTSQAANFQQWSSYAANRQHFWTYPSATRYSPTGQTGVGWSLQRTIALAATHRKTVGLAETGAGGNGSTNGPVDDPAFPAWLAGELSAPGTPRVAFVNIWDGNESDGNWDFSSSNAAKPQEAASWSLHFGTP